MIYAPSIILESDFEMGDGTTRARLEQGPTRADGNSFRVAKDGRGKTSLVHPEQAVTLRQPMTDHSLPPLIVPPTGIFAAQGVRKVYHTGEVEVVALHGVDLALDAGELVVLLGPSGSGKSTLLNILGGLDVPTSGQLSYKGWALDGAEESTLTQFRRNCVGFVFQFYNLIPSLTARENVALITGISRDPMAPEEALEMIGLADRMDHFPSQLSGGEQQRVAIARAIAKRPGGVALRRADRRAGRDHRHHRVGGDRADQPRSGHSDRGHHPQRRDGGDGGPGALSIRRPDRERAPQHHPPGGLEFGVVRTKGREKTPL
jgi:putative ABC transport system ATP-binding protein